MARKEEFNREETIKKAMTVFWEKGYSGTSIQDLVDATGLNRSSIYNSFGSKQNLYRTALDYYEGENDKVFQWVLLKSKSPLDAIRKILELAISAQTNEEMTRGCFILKCKTELNRENTSLRNWLLQNQEKSISLFRELVAEGQKEGELSTEVSAQEQAYNLFNSFQGLRMTAILTQDHRVLQNIINYTVKGLQ